MNQSPPGHAPAAQLPLALGFPPDQRFDSFVAPPAGALGQLQALAAGVESRCLYLAGAAGTGKTHLALATCADADQSGRSAAYLPLASAVGRLRDALEAMHGFGLVALDGVEALAGHREDEVALFDFHNRVLDAGNAVLYTARVVPAELALGLPDLRSRLSQCTRITLDPIDDDGRYEVLRQRAQRRGLLMDEAAIQWLLRRTGRDLAGLTTLLDRLDRESLAAKRRITVPFLRQVLAAD